MATDMTERFGDHAIAPGSRWGELPDPAVSVITVFYNRAALVRRSLDSLLSQRGIEHEVLFVDDGSTDETLDIVATFDDPRLRVIAKHNSGFTRSLKQAITQARGRFIAIHGAGDLSLPERLTRQCAFLEAHEHVGIVGCGYEYNDRIVSPGEVDTGNVLKRFRIGNPFSHGEVMFRRSVYDSVGGYDERFTYAQDFDLWLRMGELCDYAVLPQVLYAKINPPESVSQSPNKFYVQQKLAQLAFDRAEQKAAGKGDVLGSDGPLPPFGALRTRKHARRFFGKGVEAFYRGDAEGAAFVWRKAWDERHDRRGLIALMLSKLCWTAPGRATLRAIFNLKAYLFGRRYAPVGDAGNR